MYILTLCYIMCHLKISCSMRSEHFKQCGRVVEQSRPWIIYVLCPVIILCFVPFILSTFFSIAVMCAGQFFGKGVTGSSRCLCSVLELQMASLCLTHDVVISFSLWYSTVVPCEEDCSSQDLCVVQFLGEQEDEWLVVN